jgi:hypothetical protein
MGSLEKKLTACLAAGFAGALILLGGYSYFTPDTVTTRINEATVKRYDKKDVYLAFTEAGVFKNTDAWYRLKFNSSDIQNEIMKLKGKEAEITKYGWRFRPLSMYENIVGVKEVKK